MGSMGVSAASVYEARACACFFMFPHVASPLATESPTAETNVALLGDWAGPRQSGSQPHRTLSLLCTLHCEIDLKKVSLFSNAITKLP